MVVIIITLQIPGSKETAAPKRAEEKAKRQDPQRCFLYGFYTPSFKNSRWKKKIPDGKTWLLLPFPVLQFIFSQFIFSPKYLLKYYYNLLLFVSVNLARM